METTLVALGLIHNHHAEAVDVGGVEFLSLLQQVVDVDTAVAGNG